MTAAFPRLWAGDCFIPEARGFPPEDEFRFLVGLPALRPSALWKQALALRAPVLISANALSRWRDDGIGPREWRGFDRRHLGLVQRHPVALDSAGFVAARHYRGFPWSTRDYLDLAAAATWLWWASQDWCAEPEVALDEDAVLDRISGTVRLNMLCLRGGEGRAITDRFVPILQGWHPHHYLRCLERMPWALDFPLVGIGSMCRRHIHGEHGILHVLDVLDRAFLGSPARLHLFGLKSQAIAIASQHPRVASTDSQAYGVAARQDARRHASRSPTPCSRVSWRIGTPSSWQPSPPGRPFPRLCPGPILFTPLRQIKSRHELPPRWTNSGTSTSAARSNGQTCPLAPPTNWPSWTTDVQHKVMVHKSVQSGTEDSTKNDSTETEQTGGESAGTTPVVINASRMIAV